MSVSDILRTQLAWAMALALALAIALLALRPADRARVRNAILVLGACALAEVASALAPAEAWAAATIASDLAGAISGLVLIRLASMLFFHVVLPALRMQPPRIVEDIVTAGLYVGWGLVLLRLSGVDPASLVATSAVLTAVIAFSMQDTLGNVLGGVVLQLDRSLRVGDWLRVDDVSGRVVEITWRHTAVETRNRETVVIPNGWMIKNRFTVIGTRGGTQSPWRRWVRLNVDLSAPASRVCAVLEAAVKDAEIPHVAENPAPSALLMEIGPRYGSYALRYWLDDPQLDDATDSVVRTHLLAALARHGMKLGVPYQEQLDIKDNEAHREAERAGEHERRLAALASIAIFAPLTPAERESLAGHLVYAPFVAGDVITRQGATAHWLYLVVSGEADVWVDTPAGRKSIATLSAGSVFGEMGMMTGEPRRATVGARTDVVCYRLDKSGFEDIVKARPDIVESMSRILAERESQLESRRALREVGGGELAPHSVIHQRIRAFFGLG
ncbi:MAG: cyclic nucleotide-binding domain-containing protein [Usitatibacter sp.]